MSLSSLGTFRVLLALSQPLHLQSITYKIVTMMYMHLDIIRDENTGSESKGGQAEVG